MRKNTLKSLLLAVFCGFYAFCATAATSLFSDYGQIQNVQNYSTNPFWTPNAPYNQRLPQPVYVQGADLNAEDCFKVVQSLVSVQCMARDNCKNTTLADIRPTIMVQLSNLPGNNYVSACSGFIDGVFESYVAQYGTSIPNRAVAFPNATAPNQNLNNNNKIQIQNPYQQVLPEWQQDIIERSIELQQLQQQNGAGSEHLSATAFPTTYADLSFSERMANATEGWEPYKDSSAYVVPDFKTTEEWCSSGGKGSGTPECAAWEAAHATANSTTNSTLTPEQASLVEQIVAWFNPQSLAEKNFLTDLVSDFVEAQEKKTELILDEQFVYDFLSKNDNLEKHKKGLTNLTGVHEDEDFRVSVDWDEVLIELSMILDATARRRGALICENNRSYQVGIDTAMWIGTIAAAIASFGAGGAAAAGGRVALGEGLKALAKGSTKIGLKSLGKTLTKASRKQLIKSGTKFTARGLKLTEPIAKKWAGKKIVKEVSKRAMKQVGNNLKQKKLLLLASGAVTGAMYETLGDNLMRSVGTTEKSNGQKVAGTLLSLVDSDVSTDFINCQDLDYKTGCYSVCGHDDTNDAMNQKVFKPLLGRTYCVNEKDYTLYDTENGRPLYLTSDTYTKVTQKIRSDVVDKDGCDWSEDDVDMYLGSYLYDPDSLEPSASMIIEEVIRLDD